MLCTADTSTKYLLPFKIFGYFPSQSYQITFLITCTCYFSPRAWTQLVKHLLEEKQSVVWHELLWKCCSGSGPKASSSLGSQQHCRHEPEHPSSLPLYLLIQPNPSDHISLISHKNSNENSSVAFTWAQDPPLEIKGLLFQFLLHYFCKEIVLAEATQMLNLLQAVKIHRNWRSFLPWLLHCFTQGRMTGGQKQCRNRSLWPTLCAED